MNGRIPEVLIKQLAGFDRHVAQVKAREEERRAAAEQEKMELAALRRERAGDLRDYAIGVYRWRDEFLATEEARRLWQHIGVKTPLPIYAGGHITGGGVADAGSEVPEWCATVLIDGWLPRPLRAQLVYLGPSKKDPGRAPVKLGADPEDLVRAVNPDFLKALYEHLRGPDAWKFLLAEVERLKQRLCVRD